MELRSDIRRVRGSAILLALVFLAVFGALAIAFASQLSTTTAIAGNQRSMSRSRDNAESGVQYLKHAMSMLDIGASTEDGALDEIHSRLTAMYEPEYPVVVGKTQSGTPEKTSSLRFPASGEMAIGGARFHADISFADDRTHVGEGAPARVLTMDVTGNDGNLALAKKISYQFTRPGSAMSAMFFYGIYARGGVTGNGGATIRSSDGSYVSKLPDGSLFKGACIRSDGAQRTSVLLNGNVHVDGKVWVNDPDQAMVNGNININGVDVTPFGKNATDLDKYIGVPDPITPPDFDPTVFSKYATRSLSGGVVRNGVFTNVRLSGPTFSATVNQNVEFRGIVYIPASVSTVAFNGFGAKFNCVFVYEKRLTGLPGLLSFNGSQAFGSIDPTDSSLAEVREATAGYGILAPTADVRLNGASSAMCGSIIANRLTMNGSSEYVIKNGSLITYGTGTDSLLLNGGSSIDFRKDENYTPPVNGIISVAGRFLLNPITYVEVQ